MDVIEKVKKYTRKHKYKLLFGLCTAGSVYLYFQTRTPAVKECSLSQFLVGVGLNSISDVIINNKSITFSKDGCLFETNFEGLSTNYMVDNLHRAGIQNFKIEPSSSFNGEMVSLVVSVLSVAVGIYLMREHLFPKRISTATKMPEKIIRFKDIYGHMEVKLKLFEIIEFIHNPAKYRAVGARMRKGILLYGPPGTGKTMIAKAAAYEAGVDYIYTSASEFVEMYVGLGARRIRDLFEDARRKPRGCIIFIDEFDAIGNRAQSSFNQENQRNSTINQLLVQMDGFGSTQNVIVIAATNREQMIDPAILRPGRLDVKIKIQLPNQEQRAGILGIHLQGKNHSLSAQFVGGLAKKTLGFSGADLQQIINQSAYICLRHGQSTIKPQHVQQVCKEVLRR